MNYFKSRIKSFYFAINGLKHLIVNEPNASIHLVAAIVAILLGFYFKLSLAEWLWIILSILFVFITEILNTAIENLADAVTKDNNKLIGKAKDLGAVATLLAAIFALIVAVFVFGQKLIC